MKTNLKRNLIQTCLLVAALLALPAVVQAQFTYTIANGAITITGYTGPGGTVIIPDTINGLPVTGIGAQAFNGRSSLTSVTIPDNITNIGDYAFESCSSLTNVMIPDSVTGIGDYAFAGCSSLTNVMIPDSVTSLGDGAFQACLSMTSVTIGNGVTNIGAFQFCFSLTAINVNADNLFYSSAAGILFDKSQSTLLQYPASKVGSIYTIPNSVTSIGDDAFSYCTNLINIVVSDTVTNIGDFAFQYCGSLTNVNIGSGVASIRDGTFYHSGLSCVTIPDGVISIEDGFHAGDPDTPTFGAFAYCGNLASVTIGNGVTYIGSFAFLDCESLTNVTIGNSVSRIGIWSFDGCSSLTSVTIPNSVTNIGYDAFSGCGSLTNVIIGNGVTGIGDEAFSGCSSLSSVYFKGNAPGVSRVDNNATFYYLPGTTGWDSTFAGLPAALWLPRVETGDDSFGGLTNQFGFNIAWAAGQTVVLEACTNLHHPVWIPVATNTLTSDSSYFRDPQSSDYSTRFYRLRSP
jgi:hypothetical protein